MRLFQKGGKKLQGAKKNSPRKNPKRKFLIFLGWGKICF